MAIVAISPGFSAFSPGPRQSPEALCHTCTHAIGRADGKEGLECQLRNMPCVAVCAWYEREAGADPPEPFDVLLTEIPFVVRYRRPFHEFSPVKQD